jgi:hypothetical protein
MTVLNLHGLNQGSVPSPLPFIFALEHIIRKAEENKERLELNRTHQLLFCVDGNLLGVNIFS